MDPLSGIADRAPAAIDEAVRIARSFGMGVDQAVPLRSTNNVVAWLAPAPVVVKIGLGRDSRLGLELQVASELQALAAPLVFPAAEIPAVVHSRGGLDFTFWRYHAPDDSVEPEARDLARQLRRLHEAMSRLSPALRQRLPTCLHELSRARALLLDPAAVPALPGEDRRLLSSAFDSLAAAMRGLAPDERHQVIHGAPHSYNVLRVNGEVRFIDFETVCTGPIEWDAAFVDASAEDYGLPLNTELLQVCRDMGAVMTAALCWSDVDRGDLRDHAEMHLAHVKKHVIWRVWR